MNRFSIFAYGLFCYAVFFAVFLYAIGFVAGFFTPTALDGAADRPLSEAIAINLGLLILFALQHSGMARPAFKRWWTTIVSPAAERSTYVLLSSLAMIALFTFWEPMGGIVWELSNGMAFWVVTGVYLLGWLLLLYATFLIDHFDLFGLAQVWRNLRGEPYRSPTFRTPGLYKAVRHPIYVGWLIIFWAAPTMSAAHLLFAVVTTAYILIAIRWEERDLVAALGEDYIHYRQRTPALLPHFRMRALHSTNLADNH
ncbi:methanethiol S-methyltransferase [Microbulbifer litoralis]|uniref:methanethiol S-methyltransferase n=1 Tax=Microbulbifer litoralis TaxID=2933965 RepID=UPI0020279C47|nr:methanethiol S-methyltransferase [Microbulbifer sp. GX H0434]